MNSFSWNMRYADATSFPGMILWGGSLTGPEVPPGTYTVLSCENSIFCSGSCDRELTSSGLWLASSDRSAVRADCSAVRADRFDDRTDANVATASTSVPAAVPSDEIVSQLAIRAA